MRLKKIQLFGFKSFADRTEIFFDQGVTCIVGPNGCGKSNISDSIRWVLGERSAKMLRGSKMEDVIFSGTDFRKPLAYAEVSLTIDNEDRGLPIDYSEVTITRRLHRSGESEYLLNKTPCRLKDIQDIILDTGIGSNSYSMIEQGRIDYILNADAEERRFLIEEAAGISKFKVKKEEAIRKLERTEENRLRLNDIIHEVQKNIQYAERQAKRAARYREELEKLKKLEIQKAFEELGRFGAERSEAEASQSALKEETARLEEGIAQARSEQEKNNQALQEILSRYRETEAAGYGIRSKIEQNAQHVRFNQEKRMEFASRRGQMEQERSQLQERIQKSVEEIALKKNEIESLQNERTTSSAALQRAEENLKQIEAQLEHTKRLLEEYKAEAFDSASKTAQIRNEYHRLSAFLESCGQQKRKHEAGTLRMHEEARQWHARHEAYGHEIAALEGKVQAVQGEKQILTETMQAVERQIADHKKNLENLYRLIHERETRLRMLVEIEESVRANEEALLEPGANFERHFAKTLREIFTVKSGYEWALEAALDSFSRTLVAEDPQAAETLLARLLEKKSTAMGLLLKNSNGIFSSQPVAAPAHPAVLCPMAEVVSVQAGYESLFEPFFRNVFVLDSVSPSTVVQELLPYAEEARLVTRDGFVLGPHQRIYYRNPQGGAENQHFRRQAEIDSLQSEIVRMKDEGTETRCSLEANGDRFEQMARDLEAREASLVEFAVQKESFESLRRATEERLQSFKRELELSDFESREIETQEREALLRKAEVESALAQAESAEREIRDRQENSLRESDSLDQRRDGFLQEFAAGKSRQASLEERAVLLAESFQLMQETENRDRARTQELAEESVRIAEKEKHLLSEDERLFADQEKLQDMRRESDLAIELAKQDKERAEAEIQALQSRLQSVGESLQALQNRAHQLEMKLLDLAYQEKTVGERLNQTYRISLSDLNPQDYALAGTVEELNAQIDALKQKVESLGTVNLLAIEEYEELKSRYEFLIGQQKDLDDAREQLMETIRKINRTTKGLFEETFANVQRTFQEYYQMLFRGGQARLVLLDETNPLESGIEIVVRPPGKKLQSITLLSGGEKALTAIALLFALFKIKPSPFCVLDEVDAPLDEANIDRFLGVLETFLQLSQFIIVTHNRKTIAMGDALYGVTMQEAGVSKLVSVKVSTDPVLQKTPSRAEGAPEEPVNA